MILPTFEYICDFVSLSADVTAIRVKYCKHKLHIFRAVMMQADICKKDDTYSNKLQ